MHQSGRVSIMARMRDSLHAGTHWTPPTASRARCAQALAGIAGVQRHEPLLGGPEDDLLAAPPAVRVPVRHAAFVHQVAGVLQVLR